MTSEYNKPLPQPMHPEPTRPYWEGTKRHEMMLPKCNRCGEWHWYPREQCPFCMSSDIGWAKASGKGRIYMYTVVYQPAHPAFQDEVPYVNVVLQLDEGVRMVGRMEDVNIDDYIDEARTVAKINTPVEAVYKDVTEEWTIVHWKEAE